MKREKIEFSKFNLHIGEVNISFVKNVSSALNLKVLQREKKGLENIAVYWFYGNTNTNVTVTGTLFINCLLERAGKYRVLYKNLDPNHYYLLCY